jgi:hypothetical protein
VNQFCCTAADAAALGCTEGQCEICHQQEEGCSSGGQCCGGLACSDGRCCSATNGPCQADADCCDPGDACHPQGVCFTKFPGSQVCGRSEECVSGCCCINLPPSGGHCADPGAPGSSCDVPPLDPGFCKAPSPWTPGCGNTGAACDVLQPCCDGFVCLADGTCHPG